MSVEADPSLWKQVSGWLWAVLAAPIAMVWRRTENSVQKDELKDIVKDIRDSIKTHVEEDKQTRQELRGAQMKIFDKLDEIGEMATRSDATLRLLVKDRD